MVANVADSETKSLSKFTSSQIDTRVTCQVPFTLIPSNTRPGALALHNVCRGSGTGSEAKPRVSLPFSPFLNRGKRANLLRLEASNICLHIKLSLSPCAFVFISANSGGLALLFLRTFFFFASDNRHAADANRQ